MFYLQFLAAVHISRVNISEITEDKPGQLAYEICSIERTCTFLII